MSLSNQRLLLALALIIAGAGAAFRIWGITAEPMWLDESYSAYAATHDFHFLWNVVPLYETHPPFYYSLLRLWTLVFGDGLGPMRALGLACGIAVLPLAARAAMAGAELAGLDLTRQRLAGLFALALLALAPMPVEMSREVRPYPVLMLVMAAQCLVLFRLARTRLAGEPLAGGSYALYLLLLALTLWLHNLGVLFAGAMGLAFLILCARPGWTRSDWIAFLGGHVLVLLAWMPALAILAEQAPTWIKSTWLTFPPADLARRIKTIFVVPSLLSTATALLLVVAAILPLTRRDTGRRVTGALVTLALVPLLASLAISAWIAPVFILRTMTPVGIPGLVLIGIAAAALPGRARFAGWVAIVILCTQMTSSAIAARHAPPPEDWYQVVRWIAERHRAGDVILTYPNEGSLPFDRALRDLGSPLRSRPVPVAVPAIGVGGWHPTGSRAVVSLPPERLRGIADSAAVRPAPTVWLIRMGPWAYDKGDVFVHELSRERRQIDHLRTGVIDVLGLRRNDSDTTAR